MDTTTQTPRDDDVTENNDSTDIDDHHDTTEYTEEHKEDIEGGESTKDSGIHQDEDGYDESYADEEFEEDEPQSDDEKSMDIFVRVLRLFYCLHLVQAGNASLFYYGAIFFKTSRNVGFFFASNGQLPVACLPKQNMSSQLR